MPAADDQYQGGNFIGIGRCRACQKKGAIDYHHVKSRASGGSNEPQNLMPLCRVCHSLVHSSGLSRFAAKFPDVTKWLITNGWNFDTTMGRWTRTHNV